MLHKRLMNNSMTLIGFWLLLSYIIIQKVHEFTKFIITNLVTISTQELAQYCYCYYHVIVNMNTMKVSLLFIDHNL